MTILSSRNSLNNIHIYIYKGLIYIRYILHLFKYIINIKKVNGSKGVYIKKLKNTKNNSKQLLHPPAVLDEILYALLTPEQSFMSLGTKRCPV